MIRTLIQMSLGGAVLIAVIILIRLVGLSRLPKRLFPALWCLALLRLLTPLSVTLPAGVPLPALPVPDLPSVESPVTPADQDGSTANQNNPPADKGGDPGASLPATVPSPAPVTPSGAPSEDTETRSAGFPLVPAVWAAVGLGLGLYFAISRARFCREVRTAVPVENEFATRWLKRQRPRRRVRLRELAGLPSPLTYGIIRPVILVPRGFDWSDTDGACYVLYHEYTHIRRFDAAQKLLMAAALCLHWFNPLVWAMYFLLDRDLELACDEAVLLHYGYGRRRDYAETIISMEEARALPTPFGSFFSKNTAEERIRAIMKFKKNSVIALALALILVVVGTVIVFTVASDRKDDTQAPPATDDQGDNANASSGDGDAQTPPPAENGDVNETPNSPSDRPDNVNNTTEPGGTADPSDPDEPVTAPDVRTLTYWCCDDNNNFATEHSVIAICYTGDGFAVDIPNTGWERSNGTYGNYVSTVWTSTQSPGSSLEIVDIGPVTYEEAERAVARVETELGQFSHLSENKSGGLSASRNDGDGRFSGLEVSFYLSEHTTFVVMQRWTYDAHEVVRTELKVMADTFRLTGRSMYWCLENLGELTYDELFSIASRDTDSEDTGKELARRFADDPKGLLGSLGARRTYGIYPSVSLLARELYEQGVTSDTLPRASELNLTTLDEERTLNMLRSSLIEAEY